MEDLLRDFYQEFRWEVNGEYLCKELEKSRLVIHDDTVLVIDKSRVSKMDGNSELYGIICRKITKIHLGDLLQSMAACGNYDLAQKIASKHKNVLPQSFCLEDMGMSFPFDSGPHSTTNIFTNKVEMKGHHNKLDFYISGVDSQNRETNTPNESDCYEIVEDERVNVPRNVS